VLPAAVVYGAFVVWPAIRTVTFSFWKWDGLTQATWVGVRNFVDVFTNSLYQNSLIHGIVLIVFFAAIPIVVGLVLTALLLGPRTRGMPLFRVIYFLPQVVPLVAIGITWQWMYASDGIVNQFLRVVGLGGITQAWLASYDFALIALGLVGTWAMSGLCMMLFISGAQGVDPALYEAATVDGAGAVRRFLHVTLPGIRGEISIAAVITTIAALASFDIVYVTTNGGPQNQTAVPSLLVYRLAFQNGDVGHGSALAVVLSAIVIVLVAIIRRVLGGRE